MLGSGPTQGRALDKPRARRSDPPHEVYVLCDCGDVEHCAMERYVADIRIAFAEIDRLSREPVDPEIEAVMATV